MTGDIRQSTGCLGYFLVLIMKYVANNNTLKAYDFQLDLLSYNIGFAVLEVIKFPKWKGYFMHSLGNPWGFF